MEEETDFLNEGISELLPANTSKFGSNPKYLSEWLNGLPLTNLGITTQTVFNAIKEINQLDIKPEHRLELLEQLYETTEFILTGLRKHYYKKQLPLVEKTRDIAQLAITLLKTIAQGYKVIIYQHIILGKKLGKKQLAIAIQRAIHFFSCCTVEGYIIYNNDKPGIWLQIHQLHQLASEKNLQLLEIPEPGNEKKPVKTNITSSYKRILLIAAMDPYRLNIGEVLEIFDEIKQWTQKCGLAGNISPEYKSNSFIVRPDMDAPPIIYNSKMAKQSESFFILVTKELTQSLESELKKLVRKGLFRKKENSSINRKITSRILGAFGVIPKRAHKRTRIDKQVNTIIGLTSIHKIISDEIAPDSNDNNNRATFAVRDLHGSRTRSRARDVWDSALTGKEKKATFDGRHSLTISMDDSTPQIPVKTKVVTAETWKLRDISSGGYCILSDEKSAAKSQVGDLIAIREINSHDSPWQAGVIRWLKQHSRKTIAFGVQVLFPSGTPVITKIKDKDGIYLNGEKSILLPAVKSSNLGSTIITPTLNYRVGSEVKIINGHKIACVVLTKLNMSTGNFCQFEYVATSKEENLPIGKNSEEMDFDKVWNSI
ncbi:MAG: hypothetical protein D6B27_03990 [Gammaproteobacteria bacterium]|nr:MAG: hypothetical protein D6B27_03990 [Gammaproteobacteria bacterium]